MHLLLTTSLQEVVLQTVQKQNLIHWPHLLQRCNGTNHLKATLMHQAFACWWHTDQGYQLMQQPQISSVSSKRSICKCSRFPLITKNIKLLLSNTMMRLLCAGKTKCCRNIISPLQRKELSTEQSPSGNKKVLSFTLVITHSNPINVFELKLVNWLGNRTNISRQLCWSP